MINKTLKVLLLTQSSSLSQRICTSLFYAKTRVFKTIWVQATGTALELINNLSIDIILIDLSVTNDKSTVFVQQILQSSPKTFIILLGSTNNRAIAMQAIDQGAYDVIDKQCLGKNWLVRILGYNLLRSEDFKFKQGNTKTLYRICSTLRLGIMVSDLFGSIIYTNV